MAFSRIRSRLAQLTVVCALVTSVGLAEQAVDPAAGGSCLQVRKSSNIANGKQTAGESPMSTQDLRVQVNCPTLPETRPVTQEENADPPAKESPVAIGAAIAKLVMLVVVLLAAGWMFYLAGRLLAPARIADATENFYLRRHWGGFGGESSGWRVSAPFGASISGLVLAILATSLVAGTLYVLDEYGPREQKASNTPSASPSAEGAAASGNATSTAPVKPAPQSGTSAANSDGPKKL